MSAPASAEQEKIWGYEGVEIVEQGATLRGTSKADTETTPSQRLEGLPPSKDVALNNSHLFGSFQTTMTNQNAQLLARVLHKHLGRSAGVETNCDELPSVAYGYAQPDELESFRDK